MIDREHLENAGLHALGLLDPAERRELEREMRFNPSLVHAVSAAEDIVAGVALTAPQVAAPAGALARIESRLTARRPGATQRLVSGVAALLEKRAAVRPGWRHPAVPVAAGLAALLMALAWRHDRLATEWKTEHERLLRIERERTQGSAPEADRGDGTGAAVAAKSGDATKPSRGTTQPPRSYLSSAQGAPEVRLVQDPQKLQAELDRLRADRNARLHPPSGVVDLRIMEMRPPGTAPAESPPRTLLTDRVGDALARGVEPEPAKTASDAQSAPDPKTPAKDMPAAEKSLPAENPVAPKSTPATPTPPLHLSGNGASASQDIYVDQGMVNLNALNLHPDSQVVHNHFPDDADFNRYGLMRIDDRSVWDGQGWVWHRSDDGKTYVGQKVPAGWTPPDPDDPGTTVAPPLRSAPPRLTGEVEQTAPVTPMPAGAAPVESGMAGESAPVAPPWALPVLDQNGQGILIVQNLPQAPAGMHYVLGGQFSGMTEVVPLGVLPADRQSTDRLAFTVAPGLLPTGYRLSLEPIPGATDVAGGSKIILQAP